jgi:hypothetical protein
LELGFRDRTTLVVQGSQLKRLELAKSVERHNPGERVHTEQLRVYNALVKQARKNVGEHGLIEQAGVEPQDKALIVCCGRKLSVLAIECVQNMLSCQPSSG